MPELRSLPTHASGVANPTGHTTEAKMNDETKDDPVQLFFKQAKSRPWVIDIYVAIQAAMAFDSKTSIDFNRLADDIMPRSDRTKESYIPLEKFGLDALGILFECECVKKGKTDYHEYKFTRKSDGKSVIGVVKV
ncbi:MAG: hypothetical protein IJ783_08975 [Kiritimatiellae bacterium]|nr:hypothetical protein [Kiritimatiellia bacterium]